MELTSDHDGFLLRSNDLEALFRLVSGSKYIETLLK